MIEEILKKLFEILPEEDLKAIAEVRKRYPEVESFKAQFILELLQSNGVGRNHNTAQCLRFIADIMELQIDFGKKKDEKEAEENKNKDLKNGVH